MTLFSVSVTLYFETLFTVSDTLYYWCYSLLWVTLFTVSDTLYCKRNFTASVTLLLVSLFIVYVTFYLTCHYLLRVSLFTSRAILRVKSGTYSKEFDINFTSVPLWAMRISEFCFYHSHLDCSKHIVIHNSALRIYCSRSTHGGDLVNFFVPCASSG